MALPVRIWILISAAATLAGWTLSAFGQLNRVGYGIFLATVALVFFLWSRARAKTIGCWMFNVGCSVFLKKILRRFRRPLPFCFAVFAILIFAGGVIYQPTHYVALTYHIPRVLHWLASGQWHWIHTPVERMNYSGCDFEWLFTPLILFSKSYHAIFIFNWIPFLLMPGLTFSVFTRAGVRPRVAWQWMWLLPTGYIFLLQSGSAGNDAVSAAYALAAIDFALRARKSLQMADVWYSILAAALMTGTKPVSLPLLLPWAILFVPLIPLLRRQWLPALLAVMVAVPVSFFPIALMNKLNCGDWMGTSVESSQLEMHNPIVGVLGNSLELLQINFVPPLFPFANQWNYILASFIPHQWVTDFQAGYFYVGELPTEDWSGIGFGLSVLLAVFVIAKLFGRRRHSVSTFPFFTFRFFILLSPWLALLAYCAKAGMATPGRLIAPYYPLLLPLLLAGEAPAQIIRRCWWKILVGAHLFLALVVLVLSPDRPLWPAQTILAKLTARHPNSHLLARAQNVYSVYAHRADPLADVRPLLPKDAKVVGFIGNADDCDISLWLPLGSRTVKHFLLGDSPGMIRGQDIQYVVVGGYNLSQNGMTIDQWLQKSDAELIGSATATLKVSEGPQKWFVARMK